MSTIQLVFKPLKPCQNVWVTDKIRVEIEQQEFVLPALKSFADYIASQTLAVEIEGVPSPSGEFVVESEVDEQPVRIAVTKI